MGNGSRSLCESGPFPPDPMFALLQFPMALLHVSGRGVVAFELMAGDSTDGAVTEVRSSETTGKML